MGWRFTESDEEGVKKKRKDKKIVTEINKLNTIIRGQHITKHMNTQS